MQYPIAGFTQLMRWYEILELDVPTKHLTAIKHAKLIHLVVTKIMNNVLIAEEDNWRERFLKLIYKVRPL